jgi:radical SAM superfamily enzyme YgiQ (UPF0313 family)
VKALLIYPDIPATFWSFRHVLKFVSKKAAYPPLGLLTVAAMLPDEWEIRLIDMNIENLRERDLEWADCVMISAMLIQKRSTLDVLHRCRGLGIKLIAGGPLFNSTPEDFLGLVDHLILNEAELTLPAFLADLKEGTPKKVYRSDDFPPLELTPVPRWDLLKMNKYGAMLVQASRGCPFNCEFCDVIILNGRKPRVKAADQIIRELNALYELKWRGTVFFVDDNFIGNKRKTKAMLPVLAEWMRSHHYPFTFLTEASINLADDDELIELMGEAGFSAVFVGLETPDDSGLKECSKNQNCGRDLTAAVQRLQASGLQVHGGYIVGFDSDDEGIFARQIKFIQDSGVVTAMVGLLQVLPGTRLWERLKAEQRLSAGLTGENTGGTVNFIPRMDREKLIAGYRRMVRTIYSPRYFYQRVSRFLERYQPRRPQKIGAADIKAFAKTLFFLGVLGNGASQWYYWKMLFKSLIFYRSSFAEAMTLMAYGYHFRKIAQKV